MNYEKLTLDHFALNLKNGRYAGLTGARRAIGKTNWPEPQRKKAHALANKHFEGGGASAPPRPSKAPKKETSKKSARSERSASVAEPVAKSAPRSAQPAQVTPEAADDLSVPRVQTVAELIETADAMTRVYDSMQKAAAVDESLKPQLADAFAGMKHILDVLRVTTDLPTQAIAATRSLGGDVIRQTVTVLERVPSQVVQPTAHINPAGEEQLTEQQKKSQELFERTVGGPRAAAR